MTTKREHNPLSPFAPDDEKRIVIVKIAMHAPDVANALLAQTARAAELVEALVWEAAETLNAPVTAGYDISIAVGSQDGDTIQLARNLRVDGLRNWRERPRSQTDVFGVPFGKSIVEPSGVRRPWKTAKEEPGEKS